MLKCAPWTLLRGYNNEKGRGSRCELEIEKLTRSRKQVFFGSVSTAFDPDCRPVYEALLPVRMLEIELYQILLLPGHERSGFSRDYVEITILESSFVERSIK